MVLITIFTQMALFMHRKKNNARQLLELLQLACEKHELPVWQNDVFEQKYIYRTPC